MASHKSATDLRPRICPQGCQTHVEYHCLAAGHLFCPKCMVEESSRLPSGSRCPVCHWARLDRQRLMR